MGMYTDEELSWAAKVAYFNISEKDINDFISQKGYYPTLQDIFEAGGKKLYFNQPCINAKDPTGDDLKMKESILAFIDDVISGEICQGWKVVSVCDQNNKDGMYGLTIETSSQDAIIAFRGSEATNPKQVVLDWVSADFNIINGELTQQEKSASKYLDKVAAQFDYENFAVTGHSLGGDLALVSTVLSASDTSESDISTRIRQSVSFDGQGHPEEFIARYQEEINKMQGVMTHYHWSLVGACLTSLCQTTDNYIGISSDSFEDFVIKHAMESLEFEEDGSLPRTSTMDPAALATWFLTNAIDSDNDTQCYVAQKLKSVEESARIASFIIDGVVRISNLLCQRPDLSEAMLEGILELQKYRLNALSETQTGMKLRELFQIQAAFIAGLTGGHTGSDTSIPMGDWVTETLADTDSDYTMAGTAVHIPADPLVIDLDGDGFELLPAEEGVYFDENHTGLKEKTQWAAPDDALLPLT